MAVSTHPFNSPVVFPGQIEHLYVFKLSSQRHFGFISIMWENALHLIFNLAVENVKTMMNASTLGM